MPGLVKMYEDVIPFAIGDIRRFPIEVVLGIYRTAKHIEPICAASIIAILQTALDMEAREEMGSAELTRWTGKATEAQVDRVVVVGSESSHKLQAVCDAYASLDIRASVIGVPANSGVPEQPVGLEQAATGALNRMDQAKRLRPEGDVFIGIESCIVEIHSVWLDVAVVAVLMQKHVRVATSTGILVPAMAVEYARATGFDVTTAGRELAKIVGSDPTDFCSYLTQSRIPRRQQIQQAVYAALVQDNRVLRPDDYPVDPDRDYGEAGPY